MLSICITLFPEGLQWLPIAWFFSLRFNVFPQRLYCLSSLISQLFPTSKTLHASDRALCFQGSASAHVVSSPLEYSHLSSPVICIFPYQQ